MVASNREITNKNSFTTLSAMSNLKNSNNVSENIQIGAPRGRSIVASMNISRELLYESNTSSIEYAACMKVQNNNSN